MIPDAKRQPAEKRTRAGQGDRPNQDEHRADFLKKTPASTKHTYKPFFLGRAAGCLSLFSSLPGREIFLEAHARAAAHWH
jgi:hypothetical protein